MSLFVCLANVRMYTHTHTQTHTQTHTHIHTHIYTQHTQLRAKEERGESVVMGVLEHSYIIIST